MQPLIDAAASILTGDLDVAGLAALALFALLLAVFTRRARKGHRFPLRPIAAYERIRELVSQSLESGQPIHVGLGSGRIGSEATPETLMGMTVFDYVAGHAAAYNQPILGTAGEGTVLLAAQGVLQRARQKAGFSDRYRGDEVSFSGPGPMAYAAGATDAVTRDQHLASILLGRFGNEGLWIAESLQGLGVVQLGGTAAPDAVALMHTALDESVLGEEVFAAGAYLHRPSHLGSLAAQDAIRIAATLAIIAAVVAVSLGWLS